MTNVLTTYYLLLTTYYLLLTTYYLLLTTYYLLTRGDASLEYGASGPTLFEAGVSVHAKPPAAEWVRFEQLSGGQQALVAVALQLACQ
eukprot:scaffold126637_cov51-Phaeocystis_antarctica.AAC.3